MNNDQMDRLNKIEATLSPGAWDLYNRVRAVVWHMLCNTSSNCMAFADLAEYQPVQVRIGLGRLEIQYNTAHDPCVSGDEARLELVLDSPKRRSKGRNWVLRASIGHPSGGMQDPTRALLRAQSIEKCARFGLLAEHTFRGGTWTAKMVEEVRDIIGKQGFALPDAGYSYVVGSEYL